MFFFCKYIGDRRDLYRVKQEKLVGDNYGA